MRKCRKATGPKTKDGDRPVPIEVIELSTDDPEVAHDALNQLYGSDQPLAFSGDTDDFRCEFHLASAQRIGSDRVRHSMAARVAMAPTGFFLAGTMLGGTYDEFRTNHEEHRFTQGDVVLFPPDELLRATWDDVELDLVRLPFELIDRIARERCEAEAPVAFEGMRPISAVRRRSWQRLTSFVRVQAIGASPLIQEPLLEAQLAELIAAMALMTFPNSALRIDHARPRPGTSPATVRRAVAFIEEQAAEPISLSDIAASAGVTPRTLQRAFARQLDTSPSAYLRQIRLRRARSELLAADPTAGATVGAIARRWGFADPRRFAAAYRELHGHPPEAALAG
jgi:AraC-like DNA-binding protein